MRFNRKGMIFNLPPEIETFFLQNSQEYRQGFTNGYESARQEIVDLLRTMKPFRDYTSTYSSEESILEKLNSINTKDHVCALNDGEQNCDCYTQAINDIKKKVL